MTAQIIALALTFFSAFTTGSVIVTNTTSSLEDKLLWTPECFSDSGKIPLLVPHPTNCKSLFVCSSGTSVQYYCPEGEVFDAEKQECRKQGICKKYSKKLPSFESCPPVNEKDVVMFPHPTSCSMYYICDHGVAYPRKCPLGLHFNKKLRVCDWPRNAKCTKKLLLLKSVSSTDVPT